MFHSGTVHSIVTAMGIGQERLGKVSDVTFLFLGRKAAFYQMHAGKNVGRRMTGQTRSFLHYGDDSGMGTAGKENGVRTLFYQKVLFVGKGVMFLLVRAI